MTVDTLVLALYKFKFILMYSFRADISDMLVKTKNHYSRIEEVASKAFEFCNVFLHENSPHFFGMANLVADSPKHIYSLFSSSEFEKRWSRILMDDAIVTFYALLRDIIVSQSGVDASAALQCSNNMEDAEDLTGIEYLIDKGTVTLDLEYNFKLNNNSRSKRMRDYLTSNNSAYKDQLRKIDKKLSKNYKHENFVSHVVGKGSGEKGDLIFLGNLEYAGALRTVSRKLNVLDRICMKEKDEDNADAKNKSNGNSNSEGKDTGESKGANESKDTGESKGANESKDTGESKSTDESKGTGESKSANESKGTGESKDTGESKGANESKDTGESKSTDESKGTGESKGTNESKDNSENKSKKRRKTNPGLSASDYLKYREMCQKVTHILNSSKKLTAADRIYAKYKLEKELHLFLSDCLYQNINAAMLGKNRNMLGERDFDKLACCVKLPNLFSRNLIIDSAFIALHNMESSPSSGQYDFFSAILSELRGGMVTFNPYPNNEYLSAFDTWIVLYQRMIDYLSEFLFPLYESVFMCLLFESIKIEKGKNIKPENIIRLIYKQLGDYLNKKDIYDPLGRCSEHDVFSDISTTRQYFQTEAKNSNMLRYAKWCSSTMTKTPTAKAPLTVEDFKTLLPDNKTIWKHNILQIAKVSECIF